MSSLSTPPILYLPHRHHIVNINEAVVKVEGTAHLMDRRIIKDIVSFGNEVVPTTWMTCVGHREVFPMELAVVPAGTAVPAPKAAFFSDFLSVLIFNGCDSVFGIDTIAKGAWSKMTVGDASVVVPSDDSDGYRKDKFIPVAFAFDGEEPSYRVHGRCRKDYGHPSEDYYDYP